MTTLQTIQPLNDQFKAMTLKNIETQINNYNKTKELNDFIKVHNLFDNLNNFEVEYNLLIEDSTAHYDWTLYDPDNEYSYVKTYELERQLQLELV